MQDGSSGALFTLIGAGIFGAVVGIGSIMTTPDGRATAVATVEQVAVDAHLRRLRPPQPGDQWGGCNDARAAGTAPIYRDEPGYRANMDGDRDGIACEPIPY
jgi:hypothetical protein